MRAFVIEAMSLESARALYNALSEFHADLSASDGDGYRVTVELGSNDHGRAGRAGHGARVRERAK
jgi:hypothetical protein